MHERKTIHEKVEALSAHITDSIHDILQEAEPVLQHASDRISEQVNDLKQGSAQAISKATHEVERAAHEAKDRVTCMIRHEPLKSVAIAAGVGAVTAAIIGWASYRRS